MQLIGKCDLLMCHSFAQMCSGHQASVVVPHLSSDVSFQVICAQILMREFSVAAVQTLTMFMAKKNIWGQAM